MFDLVFLGIIVALYVATHGLVAAISRLGKIE